MNEGKSKSLVWILIVVILLAVSFIVYDKALNVDKEVAPLEPTVDEEIVEELEEKIEEAKEEEENEEVKDLEEKVEELEEKVEDLEEENKDLEEDVEDLEEAVEETKEEEVSYEGENFITLISPNDGAGFSSEIIEFTGEVSPNTEKIVVVATGGGAGCNENPDGVCSAIINDTYTLQEFNLGDETFSYKAKEEWDNLTGGMNNYVFTAHFDDGSTKSAEVSIEIYGGAIPSMISVSSPADGSNFDFNSTLPIVFTGEVSKNTTKIVVTATGGDPDCDNIQGMCNPYMEDIYTLQDFEHGDSSFTYRAQQEWNNLTLGPNNYTFTAYFDNGDSKNATITINFDPFP